MIPSPFYCCYLRPLSVIFLTFDTDYIDSMKLYTFDLSSKRFWKPGWAFSSSGNIFVLGSVFSTWPFPANISVGKQIFGGSFGSCIFHFEEYVY